MPRHRSGRHIYARHYTVERTSRGWYFGRTSRFGDVHGLKGPYSSERSVALMIARELIKEIAKRDAQRRLPMTGGLYFVIHLAATGIIASSSADPATSACYRRTHCFVYGLTWRCSPYSPNR